MLSYVVAGLACLLRRPLLRRVRGDGAGRRQRLHLRLHHAGRALRLDHRLGPGARIRGRRGDGRQRLVRLLSGGARDIFGLSRPRSAQNAPLALRRETGRVRARPAAYINLPAVLIVAAPHRRPGQGHQGERRLQRGHGGDQGRGGHLRDPRRRLLRRLRPTGTPSPRTAGPGSTSSAIRSPARPNADGEPVGHARRGGDHLLRLHRLRRRLDPGRGGEEPAARRADRHHRLARRSARSSTSRSWPC